MPRHPPAVSVPSVRVSEYPRDRISLMATVPTVSAVATEEPAIAEKIAQPAMLVWASPPAPDEQAGDAGIEPSGNAAVQDQLAHQDESGIATRLKLVVVLKTMSPNVGHSMVAAGHGDADDADKPHRGPIEAPKASVATSSTP